MNNKLFARIMTAVICICMMSTVVFAADPTFTAGDETATLSFKVGTDGADITVSSEDQITMMAYLVDATVETPANIPAYTNQAVVAINQVDGADGFGDVLIAASKLEAGKKIAIVIGGSDGTTEKYLVAQEVVGGEVKVTIMNGAASIELTADATGNVTLPTDTAWNGGTPVDDCVFELCAWVADDDTSYAPGAEVAAAELKDVTLYAKYDTGIIVGDVDGEDGVDSFDSTYIDMMVFDDDNWFENRLGLPIFAGSDVIIGDVDGEDGVDSFDSTYIDMMVFDDDNWFENRLGKKIYLVNRSTDVETIFAD